MSFDEVFKVIVIGAGHAGCEAASAAARLGAETGLITLNLDLVGQMSCNPAIGGIAKGHLVREIDALGGIMGRVIDRTGIQFRLLNRSRGPAVQSPRAQADRMRYRSEMRRTLEATSNLHLRQGKVVDFIIDQGKLAGVVLEDGRRFGARAVVVATGTFLNGLIHTGRRTYSGGRAGEPASIELSDALKRLGFPVGRLKTGTPPRLDGEQSIGVHSSHSPGRNTGAVFVLDGQPRAETDSMLYRLHDRPKCTMRFARTSLSRRSIQERLKASVRDTARQ